MSWVAIEENGKIKLYYLTDKEIFSLRFKQIFGDKIFTLEAIFDFRLWRHNTIRAYFGLDNKGLDGPCESFWLTERLPPELAGKIRNFDNYWGRSFATGFFSKLKLSSIISSLTSPPDWKDKAWQQFWRQNPDINDLLMFLNLKLLTLI